MDQDDAIRLAAFERLQELVAIHGEVLPRRALAEGFEWCDRRVPFMGQQGIFKPAVLPEVPLSIFTSHRGPYNDAFEGEEFLLYRYRGTDPLHRDNVGLREAMRRRKPLVYFHATAPAQYLTVWPVYIVDDRPKDLAFVVVADESEIIRREPWVKEDPDSVVRRRYATVRVRRRVHQETFRARVVAAYRSQCAMCRLRHEGLLDAAHIVPDAEGGEPSVTNGLALCKIHHAAFDQHILGLKPDYRIVVRRDILEEIDGPMLRHGLQDLDGSRILLPNRRDLRPDPESLERRFERFRKAS